MPFPSLFYNPKPQFTTSTGDLASSYQLFFYSPGTTTKKDTYTTSALSVANANPFILNSRGEPTGDIYLDGSYKVVFTTNTDTDPPTASIWTVDNVTSLQQLTTILSKTANYTVTTSDKDKFILCDATAGTITLTLPTAASAGSGFTIGAKKTDSSTNTIIIDANGAETIDGQLTYVLTQQHDGIDLVTNGTAWYSKEAHLQTLLDKNGNEIIILTTTASAVNEITVTNAATAGAPTIGATGGDTNIDLQLQGKAAGAILLGTSTSRGVRLLGDQPIEDSAGNELVKFVKTTTAVNEITITNAATGAGPKISTTGGDTNIDLQLQAKGTGVYKFLSTADSSAKIQLLEDTDNGTNYCSIEPPASITANRTITLPDESVDLTEPTQAVMETATSTTVRVSPAKQHFHPGHPKAWAAIQISGGTPSILQSYGVTSLTDTGVGDILVNLSITFNAATFCAVGAANSSSRALIVQAVSTSTTTSQVVISNDSAAAADNDFSVAFFGDL